jgi:hypothetical protein
LHSYNGQPDSIAYDWLFSEAIFLKDPVYAATILIVAPDRPNERPLSSMTPRRVNGGFGRESAIKGGVLDARFWP